MPGFSRNSTSPVARPYSPEVYPFNTEHPVFNKGASGTHLREFTGQSYSRELKNPKLCSLIMPPHPLGAYPINVQAGTSRAPWM